MGLSKKSRIRSWAPRHGWRKRSFACYDREWEDYKSVAGLVGAKSVNGWIRSWLNEAVRYERLNVRDSGSYERLNERERED